MPIASTGRPPAAGYATVAVMLALAAASIAYYGRILDSGFNIADDGHYAQVAYEFLLGADPRGIRFGYGIAWFKLGELLFVPFGPDFMVVRALFYALITATSLLVFATVARITDSRILATVTAVAAGLAPAFPATAFYAFCTLLNVHVLVRVAERWRAPRPRDVALAAAALSVTFQIRPDFGYVFCVPLAGLLVMAGLAGGVRRLAALAGVAAAAFLATLLPLLADALRGGYLDLLLAEQWRFPKTLLRYLLAVLTVAPDPGAGPPGAGTLLQRPPLAALWSGTADQAAFAVLVYAPVAVLCLFVAVQCRMAVDAVRHRWTLTVREAAVRHLDTLAVRAVVLTGALASFPHYFLFRPDLPHVANFMPGYMVLVAVLAADLARRPAWARRPGRTALRPAGAAAGLVLLLGSLGVYLAVGLTTPGTGSIAGDAVRDRRFVARNGVDVRLGADELASLEPLRRIVEEHSEPGDRIVCVPFCPGVAFMTGRRMLFGEFYVDDSLPLLDPGWIDRAIARTREVRPPVVIVLDWAINGTEASRFANWARRYVEALGAAGYRPIAFPGGLAHLRPTP